MHSWLATGVCNSERQGCSALGAVLCSNTMHSARTHHLSPLPGWQSRGPAQTRTARPAPFRSGRAPLRHHCSPAQPRCRRAAVPLVRASAGAAAWPGKYDEEVSTPGAAEKVRGSNVLPRPASLPEPPASTRLLDIMPYLVKLATSDRQLWWRLGSAVLLMFASKAAGAPPAPAESCVFGLFSCQGQEHCGNVDCPRGPARGGHVTQAWQHLCI